MTHEGRTRFLDVALEAARAASTSILRIYATDFAVDYKGKDDPVTMADKEANASICAALRAAFPGVPIVAEESDPSTFDDYGTADRAFFVDPVDGTREFVAKNGEFCVMIGMAEEGRATAGLILFPVLGLTLIGAKGVGAFQVDATGARTPIHVSGVTRLADAHVLVSRSHPIPNLPDVLGKLGVARATPCGSSGYKSTKVALGEAEIYAHPGGGAKLWDVCAPDAIVTAAGGRATDVHGGPFDYRAADIRCSRGIAITNGHIHDAIIAGLDRLAAERDRA